MSVNQYINGKLNLIAGGYGSGGGECGCEENTFTGTMEEVQAAIAAGEIKDDFIIFVTDDFEEISSDNKIEYVTQEEYDALPESKLTDNVEYRITDKGIDSVSASNVKYDGSASGLNAINVQGAVDELKDSLSKLPLYNKGNLTSVVTSDYCTIGSCTYEKVGGIIILSINITTTSEVPVNGVLLDNIPLRPGVNGVTVEICKYNAKDVYMARLLRSTDNNNSINKIYMYDSIPSGTAIRTEIVFNGTLH